MDILLVDDEELIVEELKEALEFEDYSVVSANSVAEAIGVLDCTPVDVVVTDLKMPKAGGLELLRDVREKGRDVITFVVSGHGAQSNKAEAMELGAKGVFSKPVDVDELIGAIDNAWHAAT